jgi:hypothetical protein
MLASPKPNARRRNDSTTESLRPAAQRGSQVSAPNGFVVKWQIPPADEASSGTGRKHLPFSCRATWRSLDTSRSGRAGKDL